MSAKPTSQTKSARKPAKKAASKSSTAAKKKPAAKKKTAAKKPAAKPTAQPATKPAPPAPRKPAPRARKNAKTQPGQRELFELFEMVTPQPSDQIEITVRVPRDVPVTIGGAPATAPQAAAAPPAPKEPLFRTFANLSKEEMRNEIQKSGLSAAELIAITSTLHGVLYKLASIGGKVTSRPRREE